MGAIFEWFQFRMLNLLRFMACMLILIVVRTHADIPGKKIGVVYTLEQ